MRFVAAVTLLVAFVVMFTSLNLLTGIPVNELIQSELVARLDEPASSSHVEVEFQIKAGESADEIGRRLEQDGLIRSATAFSLISRLRARDSALQAGYYRLRPTMQVSEIVAELGSGQPRAVRVTLREGLRIAEIADELAAKSITDRDRFIRLATGEAKWIEDITGRPGNAGLEGYLFPDTYEFDPNLPAEAVIERLIQNFLFRFDDDQREQAKKRGMTVHQVMTLASIVEREARVPGERPIIAGVFLNRLNRLIPLQADPTVQYAIVQDRQRLDSFWKAELTADDLKRPSPYNTYLNTGLPPGPICSPGLASIKAVLAPAETKALYFVARPDGSHAFAETLDEHNRNVQRYQR